MGIVVEKYNHKIIDQKWRDAWDEAGVYKTDDSDREKDKFYILAPKGLYSYRHYK